MAARRSCAASKPAALSRAQRRRRSRWPEAILYDKSRFCLRDLAQGEYGLKDVYVESRQTRAKGWNKLIQLPLTSDEQAAIEHLLSRSAKLRDHRSLMFLLASMSRNTRSRSALLTAIS